MLNDEQLWDKCGTGQKITYEDIGIDPPNHKDGLQTYREGFELDSDINIFTELAIGFIMIIGVSVTIVMLIIGY